MMKALGRSLLSPSVVLPAIVFLIGLYLAAGAVLLLQDKIKNKADVEFQQAIQRVTFDITQRFHQPVYGLNGAKGAYAAKPTLKRAEFRAYVESRDLPNEFPGVQGFGFIEHVMRSKLNAFVVAQRPDGAPEFTIRQFQNNRYEDLLLW